MHGQAQGYTSADMAEPELTGLISRLIRLRNELGAETSDLENLADRLFGAQPKAVGPQNGVSTPGNAVMSTMRIECDELERLISELRGIKGRLVGLA